MKTCAKILVTAFACLGTIPSVVVFFRLFFYEDMSVEALATQIGMQAFFAALVVLTWYCIAKMWGIGDGA